LQFRTKETEKKIAGSTQQQTTENTKPTKKI